MITRTLTWAGPCGPRPTPRPITTYSCWLADMSWTRLLDHFQESLRLSPDWDWPRTGVASVLRLQCVVLFRSLLLTLGLLFLFALVLLWALQTGRERGPAPPEPSIMLGVILVAVGGLNLFIAEGPPYLLMQWKPLGPAVLTPAQRQAARLTKWCLIAAAIAAVAAVLTPPPIALIFFFLIASLVGPLAITCDSSPGWGRRLMVGYTATLALTGLGLPVNPLALRRGPPSRTEPRPRHRGDCGLRGKRQRSLGGCRSGLRPKHADLVVADA